MLHLVIEGSLYPIIQQWDWFQAQRGGKGGEEKGGRSENRRKKLWKLHLRAPTSRSDKIIASKRISIGLARARFIAEIYKPATSCQPSIDIPSEYPPQQRITNLRSVEDNIVVSTTNLSSSRLIDSLSSLSSRNEFHEFKLCDMNNPLDPENRISQNIPPNEKIFHLSTRSLSRRWISRLIDSPRRGGISGGINDTVRHNASKRRGGKGQKSGDKQEQEELSSSSKRRQIVREGGGCALIRIRPSIFNPNPENWPASSSSRNAIFDSDFPEC